MALKGFYADDHHDVDPLCFINTAGNYCPSSSINGQIPLHLLMLRHKNEKFWSFFFNACCSETPAHQLINTVRSDFTTLGSYHQGNCLLLHSQTSNIL